MEPAEAEDPPCPYQGRAIFVRVKSKSGSTPAELSYHPELRFRVLPRESCDAFAALLVINGASIPVSISTKKYRTQTHSWWCPCV